MDQQTARPWARAITTDPVGYTLGPKLNKQTEYIPTD